MFSSFWRKGAAPNNHPSVRPDMIEVRDTDRAGRGVFAVRRLKAGTEVVRALPAAAVCNDTALSSHCCVCLSPLPTTTPPCGKCRTSRLCGRCAASPAARLVHDDECQALALLRSPPAGIAPPEDTRSLRLLLRLLLLRWRSAALPEEPQYADRAEALLRACIRRCSGPDLGGGTA